MSTSISETPAAAQRKKRGCVFYGCLTVLILAVVMAIGTVVGVWFVAKKVTAVLEQYTDTQALELPKSDMPQEDYQKLEERLAAFGEALEAGRTVEPLSLGEDELNALLARSPALAELQGRLHVRLEGNQVRGQLSMPLDQLGELPMFKGLRGRYLNGEAALHVGLVQGQLDLRLQALQVKGQAMPAEVLRALGQHNLAEAANQDPEKAATFRKLGGVAVEDGKLVITPRAP